MGDAFLSEYFPVVGTLGDSGLYVIKSKGKYVPLLNYAARHDDVLGNGCIAPRILDLDTRWR
jgi:hypothetical protein